MAPLAPPPDARPSSPTQLVAALGLVAGIFAWALTLAGESWDGVQAPFPYMWRDVALVQLACAGPLAWLATGFLRRRLSAGVAAVVGAAALGAAVVPLLAEFRTAMLTALFSVPFLGVFLRAGPVLGLTLGGGLLVAVLAGVRFPPPRRAGRVYGVAVAGLGLAVLLAVPALYAAARCRHDEAELGELLGQQRYGDAHTLAHGLLVLDPHGRWNGQPIARLAAVIDRAVADLEARVGRPLGVRATADQRLERARQLAMLGRTDEAMAVLDTLTAPSVAAEADTLRGTIHETRGAWEPALRSYQEARAGWQARPETPDRAAGLARATAGIAYCQRKLGRYAAAEATYLELLGLAPTAETHFLLAQFYDDAQQADWAREHARRAMALAPDRYEQAGAKLIRKLAVFQFGCWGVHAAESAAAGGSLAR